jgi:hypothetical protein
MDNTSLGSKLFLATYEKLLLAIVVAVAVAAVTLFSDRLKSVWSTAQDKLFTDRLTAYTELLRDADDAVSEIALTYGVRYSPDPDSYKSWRSIIGAEKEKTCKLYPSGCSGFGGGSIPDGWEIVRSLDKLQDARDKYRLLIPNDLDTYVGNFMLAVVRANDVEVDYVTNRRNQPEPDYTKGVPTTIDVPEAKESWKNVLSTHRALSDELRTTLGLDLTAAKPLAIGQ